jgi:hypothetical protein
MAQHNCLVFLVVAYRKSGHGGSESHLVELPSTAKPANEWNLPIAGAAVQINRVQYFSLSALVRQDRPVFVMF